MPYFNTKISKGRGFTIIELILVIAIISFLAVLSSPFYSRFLLQNAVDNTVSQLAGSLRKAQIYSMMGKQGSGWSVNYGGVANTITLYKGTTAFALRPNPSADETFSINPNVSVSGITDINFARITGMPAPTGPTTVTISSGTNSKTIIVNLQGVTTK